MLLPWVALAACGDGATALVATPERTRTAIGQMLDAFAVRFGPADYSPELEKVRPRLIRYALTPSRLFADREVWTASYGELRSLEVAGAPRETGYLLRMESNAEMPASPAQARHVMHLERLRENELEWRSRDEVAVGSITGEELDRLLTSFLLAAERSVSAADAMHIFPRSGALLGRAFRVDTARAWREPNHEVSVALSFRMRPAGLADRYPTYAKYAADYLIPLRFRAELRDANGARWVDVRKHDDRLGLRLRVRDGFLVPLDGGAAAKRLPDTLTLHLDASAKAMIFRVGLRALVADIVRTRSAEEKAFAARFRREPDWELPPLVEPMLRSPLRRPFQGEGALLGFGVTEHATGQTLVWRDIRIALRESAILRFLGRLGATAMGDFRRGAEREAERFYADVLTALREDIRALPR